MSEWINMSCDVRRLAEKTGRKGCGGGFDARSTGVSREVRLQATPGCLQKDYRQHSSHEELEQEELSPRQVGLHSDSTVTVCLSPTV